MTDLGAVMEPQVHVHHAVHGALADLHLDAIDPSPRAPTDAALQAGFHDSTQALVEPRPRGEAVDGVRKGDFQIVLKFGEVGTAHFDFGIFAASERFRPPRFAR